MRKKRFVYKNFPEVAANYKTLFFDLTGVLWHGCSVYKKAFEMLNKLKWQNKDIFFISNASLRSREDIVAKLVACGYKDAHIDQIYPVSYFGPLQIKKNYPAIRKMYVIGREALQEGVKAAGIEVLSGIAHDNMMIKNEKEFNEIKIDPEVKGIIVGEDF